MVRTAPEAAGKEKLPNLNGDDAEAASAAGNGEVVGEGAQEEGKDVKKEQVAPNDDDKEEKKDGPESEAPES